MGELSLPMKEWFPSGNVTLWDDKLTVSPFSPYTAHTEPL